jgi:hypothetical protein
MVIIIVARVLQINGDWRFQVYELEEKKKEILLLVINIASFSPIIYRK